MTLGSEVQRAIEFGAGAAVLRTGSIFLSKNLTELSKINPALGIAGTFFAQALTVSAITSGALATYYTTAAVTKRSNG